MPYEHLQLTRWPFPVVPEPAFCDFIADRRQLNADVESMLRSLGRQDVSSMHLLWSWFGAGKTHTLFYFANRARQLDHYGYRRIQPVYSEFPKDARSFVDLYRSFVRGLDTEYLVNAYLEIVTSASSKSLRDDLLYACPDLLSAVHTLATGTDVDRAVAIRWLQGEPLPASEFRRIGVYQKVSSAEEATRNFAALVRLFTLASKSGSGGTCRIVWLLDEFQRIERLPPRTREQISVGLHSTFNACPTGLSIIFSFSGKPEQQRLPHWFSRELQDRIGRTKVLILPPMMADEAMDFIRDTLKHLRTLEGWDAAPYFPFTEDACRHIISDVQQEEELKPRAIMHAFNAVLQEADPLLETGEMSEISAEFAKRVLAEYVPPPVLEEGS